MTAAQESDMLSILMSLLSWTLTEGVCSDTYVTSYVDNMEPLAGEAFKLSCEFNCLGPQHVAQLWRDTQHMGRVCMVNVSSIQPNVTLVLHISPATPADAGYYSCMTNPPDTISPQVYIGVGVGTEPPTTGFSSRPSVQRCDRNQQHTSRAGLQGQIWYWMLLGKTAVLLLTLASLAVKYNSGREK